MKTQRSSASQPSAKYRATYDLGPTHLVDPPKPNPSTTFSVRRQPTEMEPPTIFIDPPRYYTSQGGKF